MKKKMEKSIADSLEVESTLLPFMPYLLQDMWALGSSVEKIIELIGKLKFNQSNANFLDLGCGKGAVSIQIATKYGYRILGIDGMEEFLEFARKKANELGVAYLCDFQKRDIIDFTKQKHDFDLVILASLGGILGDYTDTITILRNQVKNGGYIVIDDGFLINTSRSDRKGYEHYRNYEETLRELTRYGDKIIMEIDTTDESVKINEDYIKCISVRSKELKEKYPELNETVDNYLALQKEECEVIENDIRGRIWIILRND